MAFIPNKDTDPLLEGHTRIASGKDIQQLLTKGMSYRQIAEFYCSKQVPTKTH